MTYDQMVKKLLDEIERSNSKTALMALEFIACQQGKLDAIERHNRILKETLLEVKVNDGTAGA